MIFAMSITELIQQWHMKAEMVKLPKRTATAWQENNYSVWSMDISFFPTPITHDEIASIINSCIHLSARLIQCRRRRKVSGVLFASLLRSVIVKQTRVDFVRMLEISWSAGKVSCAVADAALCDDHFNGAPNETMLVVLALLCCTYCEC